VTDKSQILFVLSYMGEGQVELWSNVYVDEALQQDDWRMWEMFTRVLARDFGDNEEPH
jgi:hypothetical protein